jgi:hypothetical protein
VFVKSRIKKGPFNVELLLAVLLLSTAVSSSARTYELLLQPGPEVGKDAFVWRYYHSANYGDDDRLRLLGSVNDIARSYVEFVGLGPYVGSGYECLSATLSVYWYGGNPAPTSWLCVYRAAGPWEEDTLTWDNRPGFNGDPCVYSGPVPDEPSWIDIDCVTEIVNGWFYGEYEHYGFVIRLVDENSGYYEYFYSSDNPHDEKPKLYIEYQCTGVEPASLGEVKGVYR